MSDKKNNKITIDVEALTRLIDGAWSNYKNIFGIPDKGPGTEYESYRIWGDSTISFYWYDYRCMEPDGSDAVPLTMLHTPMVAEKRRREAIQDREKERDEARELEKKRKKYERLKKELGE